MKIWYENFYLGFEPKDYFFNDILRTVTDVEVTPNNPDLVIYEVFGNPNNVISKYKCKVAFFASEKVLVGTDPLKKVVVEDYPCDFSISYDEESKTNIQCPLWVTYLDYKNTEDPYYYKVTTEKRKFYNKNKYCNFIFGNPAVGYSPRTDFFKFLSEKRFVHSAGRFANNIGHSIGNTKEDKLNYIKDFLFTIAFENAYDDVYMTEKLLHPLLSTSIPIYWGGKDALKYFDSNTFINAHNKTFEEVENEMNEILEDKDHIIKMCTVPIFEKFPESYLPETIATKILDKL